MNGAGLHVHDADDDFGKTRGRGDWRLGTRGDDRFSNAARQTFLAEIIEDIG